MPTEEFVGSVAAVAAADHEFVFGAFLALHHLREAIVVSFSLNAAAGDVTAFAGTAVVSLSSGQNYYYCYAQVMLLLPVTVDVH